MNIMLISENRRLLMNVSHYFRGLNSYYLDIIHSSPLALESFAETKPECIIIDDSVIIPHLSIIHAMREFEPECKFIVLTNEAISASENIHSIIHLSIHNISQETIFEAIDTLRKTSASDLPTRVEKMMISFGKPASFQLYHDVYYIMFASYIERGRPNRSRLKYRIRSIGAEVQKQEGLDVMLFRDMDLLIAFRKSTHTRVQSILTYVKRLCGVKFKDDPCYTIFAMEHVPWNSFESAVDQLQMSSPLSYFFPGQIIANSYIQQHKTPLSLLTVNLYVEKTITALLHQNQEQATQFISDLFFHHIKQHVDITAAKYFNAIMNSFCSCVIYPLLSEDLLSFQLFPTIYDEFKNYERQMKVFHLMIKEMKLSLISIRALEYIFHNHAVEISLSSVANSLQVTKEYLSRVFKKELKRTILDFIQTIKMTEAALYLEFTDLKIYEVAASVGFQDTHYFSRLFKKLKKMSPEQYRRSIRGVL